MSDALAFIFFLVLIGLGWKQPYSAHLGVLLHAEPPALETPAAALPAPAPRTSAAAATTPLPPVAAQPPADRSWMFEKTAMDAPAASRTERKGGPNAR